jgi:hypothetical protein
MKRIGASIAEATMRPNPRPEKAFEDLVTLALSAQTKLPRATTRRERVLAKILIDIYALRLVDLAAIMAVAKVAVAAPPQTNAGGVDATPPPPPRVVIFYGGASPGC